MSSESHQNTYTCDLCGSGPWKNHEVAEIWVEIRKPPVWETVGSYPLGSAAFDVCRACLGTSRAPNPSMEFENSVSVGSNSSSDVQPVAIRVLRWFFGDRRVK